MKLPPKWDEMVRAALRDDWATARAIESKYANLFEANFWDSNPGPVKTVLNLMGKCNAHVRLPLVRPMGVHARGWNANRRRSWPVAMRPGRPVGRVLSQTGMTHPRTTKTELRRNRQLNLGNRVPQTLRADPAPRSDSSMLLKSRPGTLGSHRSRNCSPGKEPHGRGESPIFWSGMSTFPFSFSPVLLDEDGGR
jgi:hypothetical protein